MATLEKAMNNNFPKIRMYLQATVSRQVEILCNQIQILPSIYSYKNICMVSNSSFTYSYKTVKATKNIASLFWN